MKKNWLCIRNILIFNFAILFFFGFLIGRWSVPKPSFDIDRDERGCIVAWDDGTYSYKSRTIHLGTLNPKESKIIDIGSFNGDTE